MAGAADPPLLWAEFANYATAPVLVVRRQALFTILTNSTYHLINNSCPRSGSPALARSSPAWSLANPGGTFGFAYSVPDGSSHWFGDVTFAKVAAVPEPGSLGLLGIGLLGFGLAGLTLRRRAA